MKSTTGPAVVTAMHQQYQSEQTAYTFWLRSMALPPAAAAIVAVLSYEGATVEFLFLSFSLSFLARPLCPPSKGASCMISRTFS